MDDARRWVLALAAPVGALKVDLGSPERFARALDKLEREGTEAAHAAIASLGDPASDNARQAAARASRRELGRAGLAAWDAARLVAAAMQGVEAKLVDEAVLWTRLLLVGHALQKTYASWAAFADGFELGQRFMNGGVPHKATLARLEQLRTAPDSPWAALPWKLDLGVAGAKARARYLRSKCGHCGGIKEQPSKTAYVYCDFCGELCDYDLHQVRAQPAATPPSEDERLRRRLEDARAAGDRALYRTLQAQQYAQLAETSPQLFSPRIADPDYRRQWVAYMADAITALAFDDETVRLDAAYQASMSGVVMIEVKQQQRFVPASFPPVLDAYLARLDRVQALYTERGLFARHPDAMTPALWRRIECALFVQQLATFLDERTLAETIQRLGLAHEIDTVASTAKRSRVDCHRCGAALEVVRGARRVVCEHCGHRLELVAR